MQELSVEGSPSRGRPPKQPDKAKEQSCVTAARDAVCRTFRVSHKLLDSQSKKAESNIPRQAMFYLLYHVGVMPEQRIADVALPESRARNTVRNGIRTVRDVMSVDDDYKAKIMKAMRIMMNSQRRVRHGQ